MVGRLEGNLHDGTGRICMVGWMDLMILMIAMHRFEFHEFPS